MRALRLGRGLIALLARSRARGLGNEAPGKSEARGCALGWGLAGF